MPRERPYILVVDDLADAADSLTALLPYWGYDASACYDGVTALESVVRRQPSVVILDIAMPRMNGFEFVARLHKLRGCELTSVVALTGVTAEVQIARARELRIDRFLFKPVDPVALQRVLAELVQDLEFTECPIHPIGTSELSSPHLLVSSEL